MKRLMAAGVIMREVIITETDSPAPIRITPPWIIIIIGIGGVIVFRPKIVLPAQEEGVSVIHLTEGFGLLSLDFTCDGNLFSFPEDI